MKIKMILIAIISSVMLVGCTDTSGLEDINQEQEQNQEAQDNTDDTNDTVNIQGIEAEDNDVLVKLYTIDVEDTTTVIPFEDKTFTISTDKSIEHNLQELCTVLQKEYFKEEEGKMEVVSINQDNIATINLVNAEAWMKHFQGSTGGTISQGTIVETLLQRDYDGEWISGLKIQVDGKVDEEYDHASFVETFMRK